MPTLLVAVVAVGNGNKSIRIEMAQGPGNSFAPRHMYGGLGFDELDYNIYLDAQHRMVWGTGEGPTQVYTDNNPPNDTPVIVPAFGRIMREPGCGARALRRRRAGENPVLSRSRNR